MFLSTHPGMSANHSTSKEERELLQRTVLSFPLEVSGAQRHVEEKQMNYICAPSSSHSIFCQGCGGILHVVTWTIRLELESFFARAEERI